MSATVLQFPTPAPKDCDKSLVLRCRNALQLKVNGKLIGYATSLAFSHDLTMDHADPEDTHIA